MPFGHTPGIISFGIRKVLVDEIGRVVAFLHPFLFVSSTDMTTCFRGIDRNDAPATEWQFSRVGATI